MQNVLFILGIALFIAGVAFIYWPAALVCLGIILVLVAAKGFDDDSTNAPRNPQQQ